GQPRAGVSRRSPALRHRRADPARSRRQEPAHPDEQPEEDRRDRGLRPARRRAGAARDPCHRRQPPLPDHQARQARPHLFLVPRLTTEEPMAGPAARATIRTRLSGARFAVVAGRFNEPITKKLVDGALEAFTTHGVGPQSVDVHWVPGSFELPQAALALARTARYAGIVCVGAVIKGETPHHEYVAGAALHRLSRAA